MLSISINNKYDTQGKEWISLVILSRYNKQRQSGFTIVELLIVIVIIGILAAITIIAYNGIQQRARNTQVIAGVESYNKALLQYAVINGSYPNANGCLGAGYPAGQCWQGVSGTWSVNSALDASIATVMNSTPVLATTLFSIGIGNNMRAGALYQGGASTITYYLQGASQDCKLSGVTATTEGGIVTQCRLTLP